MNWKFHISIDQHIVWMLKLDLLCRTNQNSTHELFELWQHTVMSKLWILKKDGMTCHYFKIKLNGQDTFMNLMREPQYNGTSYSNKINKLTSLEVMIISRPRRALTTRTSFYPEAAPRIKLMSSYPYRVQLRQANLRLHLFSLESFRSRGSRLSSSSTK